MSLLNLTNDGLPNILVVLYTTLARSRSALSAQDLLEAVAPEFVVRDPRLARTTLNRWIELGLFKEDPESRELSLDRKPTTDMKSEADIVRAVRMAARRVALSHENNSDLWAREEARAADLFAMVESGKVKIDVRQRFPLADAAAAHIALEARRTTGSTILLP